MSGYTLGWYGWILWFLVEEGAALFRGGLKATLSYHVWHWFAIHGPGNPAVPVAPTGWMRARRFALVAFLAWLNLHFLTGGVF